jgi:hypothetical protein
VPSNFLALVNKTVLAGMLRPMAKVSVAKSAFMRPSPNKISVVSFKIGSKPGNLKRETSQYSHPFPNNDSKEVVSREY